MRLVLQGEAHAFEELVGRYLRGSLAVALQYARDLDEAEDIVQDAFMRTLSQLDRFDQRLTFRPWYYTILRNVGRNIAQRRARMGAVPLTNEIEAQPGAGGTDDAEIRRLVEQELTRMPESQASCFRLCEIEGFDSTEVADMLGVAPATVRTHVHRARLKLRESLTRSGFGSPE